METKVGFGESDPTVYAGEELDLFMPKLDKTATGKFED